MKIKKVALIGAGAVGGYFIWGIMEKMPKDCEFTVIAEGARKEKLETNGIKINDHIYRPNIKTPKEAGIQDLILVATKYNVLDEAVGMLPELVGDETLVLSLLNGVDSEERIAEVIGEEHLLYSIMRIASKRDEDDISFNAGLTKGLIFGEKDCSEPTIRTNAIKSFFDNTQVNCTWNEDIVTEMWDKFASNIANNLVQAVLGVVMGAYNVSEHAYFLAEKLWLEVRSVAEKKGIILNEKVHIFNESPQRSKFSTLQDLEAGRHTEIDMFAGQMIRMGEELGISVPYCTYTYHAIKALEEKNAGLFDESQWGLYERYNETDK